MELIKKRYIIVILILCFFIISTANAEEISDKLTDNANQTSTIVEMDSGHDKTYNSENDEVIDSSNVIYFDASASANGDGSKSNPYKYVDQNTLKKHLNFENDLTAYFAEGTYTLNSDFKIYSNVVFIGENGETPVFDSILSNKYDFEIMKNSNLKLVNITLKHANVLNHGTLQGYDTKFYNSKSFMENGASTTNSNNYDSSYGGVINCNPIGDSIPYVYLENCLFNNNVAYCGGAISLKNSCLTVNNTRFEYSEAERKGGVIYSIDSTVNIFDANFLENNASYGGIVFCEKSLVNFKNTTSDMSESYSFGGAIASKYSNITIDSSTFKNYRSYTDAGGVIYNFKGNLDINDSKFISGTAEFGGAICNLNSNLNIFSSYFRDHSAALGGVIYNIYGKLYIENNTFFYSGAQDGSVLFNQLSDLSYLINNTFLQSPTLHNNSCIFCDSCSKDLIQYGNHFEDYFLVSLEFSTNIDGEDVLIKSNVLTYILSNTGTYKNSYEPSDSIGDTSNYASLNIYDSNYKNDSMIYGSYNDEFKIYFNFTANFDKYYEHVFKLKVSNFLGYTINEFAFNMAYESLSRFDMKYPYSFKSHMIREYPGSRLCVENEVITSINSVPSDLNYIPSSYDSRNYGYVTPVKNQAEGGNCWAFAGIATLETCIKKITGITYDFSEENVKNMMAAFSINGLDIEPNFGGYDSMVMGYMAAWYGPTLESYDVYDDLSSLSRGLSADFHIQDIYFLPPRENGEYDYLYKKAIMDYGAVSITFHWADAGLHSVSLVGWNDNYNNYDSLGRFTKGAWIFKNSWGSSWGDNGFGYLSYDTPFASDLYDYWHAYSFVFNKDANYVINLHTDSSGVSDYICSDGPITCSININGAKNSQSIIHAFATYFKVPTNYIIEIRDRDYDFLILHQEGYSDAGYHTIELNKAITMSSRDQFVFSITFNNKENNYLPVSLAEELTRSQFSAGNYFYSDNYETNADLYFLEEYHSYLYSGTRAYTCQAPCIHFFTKNSYSELKSVQITVDKFESVNIGENIEINAVFNNIWSSENNYEDVVKMIEGTLVTFNINEKAYYALIEDGKAKLNITLTNPGDYLLDVDYNSNKVRINSQIFTFKAYGNSIISASTVSMVYGGNGDSVITLKDNMGNAISGAVVYFNVGGKTTTLKTNAQGQATMHINLAPNTYNAKITFESGGNYIGSATTASVIVKKATSKIIASKKTFKLKAKSKKYTITLKDSSGNLIKNVKVKVKVKGKSYTAKTNTKGKATFKLKLTKRGNFKTTILFSGNSYYNKATKNVKIKIK